MARAKPDSKSGVLQLIVGLSAASDEVEVQGDPVGQLNEATLPGERLEALKVLDPLGELLQQSGGVGIPAASTAARATFSRWCKSNAWYPAWRPPLDPEPTSGAGTKRQISSTRQPRKSLDI